MAATGWSPQVPVAEGIERLAAWLTESGTAASAELVGSGVAL
jgi:nucleoside-diphosphate-sugar epimerase